MCGDGGGFHAVSCMSLTCLVLCGGGGGGDGGGGDRYIDTGCRLPKKSLQKCQQRTCALVILMLEQNSGDVFTHRVLVFPPFCVLPV